jgi:diguanylate cyclase (GGDEF)-like protein
MVIAVVALGAVVTTLNLAQSWVAQPLNEYANAIAALALTVALGTGVFRFAGRSRPVWMLILLGQCLSSLAVIVVEIVDAIGDTAPVPGWAYTLHLLAHQVQVLALLLLVRRRGQGDRAAWLDAALLALTAFALVWGLVLDLTDSANAGPLAVLLGPFPTAAGIAIVAVMLRVVLVTGRDGALLLLLAAVVTVAAADIGNNIAARTIPVRLDGWVDAMWIASFSLTLAAALHPRASRITNEQPSDTGGLGTVRIVALAVGALLIPSLLVLAITVQWTTKFTVWAWMSVVAMAIVLVRLWLAVQALQVQTRYLAVQARTDALTGLANRRTWEYQVARTAMAPIEGPQTTRVLAMADLDYFKAFNDAHGHRSGDEMLRRCAMAWRDALGTGPFLARYGGEEFALTLHADSTVDADERLDELRRATPAPMTVSIGATEWPVGESAESVVERADLALYAAKNLGRDRVEWLPTVVSSLHTRGD